MRVDQTLIGDHDLLDLPIVYEERHPLLQRPHLVKVVAMILPHRVSTWLVVGLPPGVGRYAARRNRSDAAGRP